MYSQEGCTLIKEKAKTFLLKGKNSFSLYSYQGEGENLSFERRKFLLGPPLGAAALLAKIRSKRLFTGGLMV